MLAAERLHGDDTTVPILAKGKTDTGRVWVYVRDDRPFGGPAPPAALFHYSRDRSGEHPERHLGSFTGILQADAYAGYNGLYDAGPPARSGDGSAVLEPCAAQVLRAGRHRGQRAQSGKTAPPISPLALEAVRRIDPLFDIERDDQRPGRGRAPRRAQELSAPLVAELETWMRGERAKLSRHHAGRPGDRLHAQALGRLHPLPRRRADLPDQQRRRARAARLRSRRKSWLFAGSDRGGERAAVMYS